MPGRSGPAPMAAMMNQICREGSSKWLTRRVTPIRPSTYSGMNATQKPTTQKPEGAHAPGAVELAAEGLGEPVADAGKHGEHHAANDHVVEVGDQEQAVVQHEVGWGTASSTPVMPPMANVTMKATVHIMGSSKRMRPCTW